MCRHKYPLPYALVKREADERITEAINSRRASMYNDVKDQDLGRCVSILQSTFKVTNILLRTEQSHKVLRDTVLLAESVLKAAHCR